MKQCEITLPYPQSLNHYKGVGKVMRTKSGKLYQVRFNSPATEQYYRDVYFQCRLQSTNSFGSQVLFLEIDVYPPDKRRRDLDNVIKVCVDSLQKSGLFDDDYQIAKLLVTRKEVLKAGKIIVRLQCLELRKDENG